MMVQGPGPKKRFTRNLLKSLETGECIEGPMRALKTFVDDKKRVKVNSNNFGLYFHTNVFLLPDLHEK